jgi:hypothetical protein
MNSAADQASLAGHIRAGSSSTVGDSGVSAKHGAKILATGKPPYDPEVQLSRLLGANRRFIEQHVPHLGSLLRSRIEDVLEHAEVVVVGSNDSPIADALCRHVSREHIVVDLAGVRGPPLECQYVGLSW